MATPEYDARAKSVRAIIKTLIEQHPIESHFYISRMLNIRKIRTPGKKKWTATILREFMQNYHLRHKNDVMDVESVIAENRLESMRLV